MQITKWPTIFSQVGRRVDIDADALLRSVLTPGQPVVPKNELPGWSPATFVDDTRKRANVERVDALVLDYDDGEPFADVVGAWGGFRGAVHTTASSTEEHQRCRVIVVLSRPVTAAEHGVIYAWALDRAAAIGHAPDTSTRDPSRFWYVPVAVPGYEAAELTGELLDVDQVLTAAPPEPAPPTNPKPPADWSRKRKGRPVTELFDEVRGAVPGERNSTLIRAAFMVGQRVEQGELTRADAVVELEAAATSAGLPAREATTTIARGLDAGEAAPRRAMTTTIRAAPMAAGSPAPVTDIAEARPRPRPNWQAGLDLTSDDKIRRVISNALKIVDHHPALSGVFRLDRFGDRTLVMRAPPFHSVGPYPRWLENTDYTELAAWISDECGVSFGVETMDAAVAAVAKRHAFDSLRDWITGLQWDGRPRIETWGADLLGCEPTPINVAFTRKWLIAGAARAMRPGAKVDTCLVLEGAQGVGKSTALRYLFGNGWFQDNPGKLDDKDSIGNLLGCWGIELAELDSLKRSGLAAVKAYMTRTEDIWRPPYGRTTVRSKRRSIFAATTNETSYLIDTSGNRRWWPIKCGRIDVDGIIEHRDQLWAEARTAYEAGEPWWLEGAEETAAMEAATDERRSEHPWESELADYMGGRDQVTIADAIELLGIPVERQSRRDSLVIAGIFQAAGFADKIRRRLPDGRRAWFYVRSNSR